MSMYCSSCGSLIKDGQSFCANCGTPVSRPVQPAPQPTFQPVPQPVPQQAPVCQQSIPQPAIMQSQPVPNKTGSSANKVPTVSKVFGWISIIMSGLGIIGAVLMFIASAMPSGSSVLIQSEDAAKLTVLFIGMVLGWYVSSLGGVAGLISLITMLVKKSKSKIWLPITGLAAGVFAFFAATIAMVGSFG